MIFDKDTLSKAEANILAECMKENRYNQSTVSRTLGISRTALRQKLITHFGNEYVGGKPSYKTK